MTFITFAEARQVERSLLGCQAGILTQVYRTMADALLSELRRTQSLVSSSLNSD
jgi:hypothetical protein